MSQPASSFVETRQLVAANKIAAMLRPTPTAMNRRGRVRMMRIKRGARSEAFGALVLSAVMALFEPQLHPSSRVGGGPHRGYGRTDGEEAAKHGVPDHAGGRHPDADCPAAPLCVGAALPRHRPRLDVDAVAAR